jgi:hypothetical protein
MSTKEIVALEDRVAGGIDRSQMTAEPQRQIGGQTGCRDPAVIAAYLGVER